ncbi:GntR family transcriptional regulator [Corynebacterium flavescens]|uniref:GntR family transcriptional regulator n=1 Tax=Corynebacterium flavescens TaxID=28028 RepID=UPI00289C81A2|nr:GntR family transcriptional regulator [Corynebacterium flavescens]
MEKVEKLPSLTEQAMQQLRSGILDGSLEVDQVYSATELGARLGVSRTPVREALLELERRGLVRIEKNKGARILSTSISSLIEVFQIRLFIEVPLARRTTDVADAADRREVEASYEFFEEQALRNDVEGTLKADRDFHTALLRGAGNQKALQILQDQRDFVLSTGVGTVPKSRTAIECFHDHDDIMAGFRARDSAAVGIAVGRHITNTARLLIGQETGAIDAQHRQMIHESLDWYIH